MNQRTPYGRPTAIDTRWILLLIFVVGLAIRLAFTGLPRVARWDESSYLAIARSLLAGNGYIELSGVVDLQQPPLVTMLAMVGLTLGLPLSWAAAGPAHVLLGSLVILPMYGLARELYGQRVGLLAALLGATYPALAVSPLYWSTMTEPPYVLFVLTGLYATLRCSQSLCGQAPGAGAPWGWAALMGGAFGLGYLVRPEALVFLAVTLAYLGIIWLTSGRRQLARLLASGAIAVAITALLALPYVLYLHQATGLWVISGKQGVSMDIAWAYVNDSQTMHDQAAASLDAAGQEILWLSPQALDKSLTAWIAEDPRRFVILVRANIRDTGKALFHEDLFTPWIVALMALGLFGQPWTRARWRHELLLLMALAPLASIWLFFVLSRFLVVYVAIGLIWAAAGLAQISRWAADSGHNLLANPSAPALTPGRRSVVDWLRVLPVAGTITLLLVSGLGVAANELPRQPFYHVEAGRWLAENVPAGSPIMTRNTDPTLYAGLPKVAFPNASWPDVLAYGQDRGARYLVVNSWEIEAVRPYLAPLLTPEDGGLPPGLAFRHRIEGRDRTVFIYEFVPEAATDQD
jgi:4-amino-4-deoxy-L-arabinose transferase-like glycosyltransferase